MDSALFSNVFLDHESSDVRLLIHTTDQDSEADVPGHSLVLRLASKVFRAMLDTANFKEGRTGILELKVKGNMEDAIVFLRYLYTRNLEHLDMSVYISVLQTAHLYDVDDLVRLCNERIVEQLSPLTVCQAYRTLKNVASPELLTHCKNLMLDYAFLIFKKKLHLTLDEETMGTLLASDKLNVLNEDQALYALWSWGCAQLTLKGCLEKSVEMKIKKILVFIRRPLLTNMYDGAPWFRMWKLLISGTEEMESNTPPEISVTKRQPSMKNELNKFSEVARISQVVSLSKIDYETTKTTLKCESNCLMIFSLDQNILFSGVTIQVTAGEQLISKDMFTFFVIQEDELSLGSPEMILVNQYTSQKVIEDPPEPTSNLTKYPISDVSRRCAPGKTTNECRTKTEDFYVYDFKINLRTPILLKAAEHTVLELLINRLPKSGVSLRNLEFYEYHTLSFNRRFKVRLWEKVVGVRELYYFV